MLEQAGAAWFTRVQSAAAADGLSAGCDLAVLLLAVGFFYAVASDSIPAS
jgi:hypothetical protein